MSKSNRKAAPGRKPSIRVWLQRFGIGGFVFFTVKGLLWLLIPWLLLR